MDIHLRYGNEATVNVLDQIKALGFRFSTQSGMSIGLDDMLGLSQKLALIQEAQNEVMQVYDQYNNGVITNGERYNKVIDIWPKVTEQVADELFSELGTVEESKRGLAAEENLIAVEERELLRQNAAFNLIYMMADPAPAAVGSRSGS